MNTQYQQEQQSVLHIHSTEQLHIGSGLKYEFDSVTSTGFTDDIDPSKKYYYF